jgi:hypothetical protein
VVVCIRRTRCSRIDWKHMAYIHILEMLDEYLDRLMQARQLLLTLDLQRGGSEPVASGMHASLEQAVTARKRSQPKPRKLPKSEDTSARASRRATEARFMQKELSSSVPGDEPGFEALGEGPLKAEERAEPVQSEVFAAPVGLREAMEPKRETRRGRVSPMPRALGGMVPAVPVFIPAARVQQELTQKAEAGTKEEGALEMPVTVELLTQRWVQGLVS